MQTLKFSCSLIHPRYWPVWLGVGLWAFVANVLPFRVQMVLGAWIGRMLALLNKKRRIIARKNLAVCFPELTHKQREKLFWQNMESFGRGLFDLGIAWFWPYRRLKPLLDISGLEHLLEAQNNGKGALLIGVHTTSLELGGPAIRRNINFAMYGVYRLHANAAFDFIQTKCRERSAGQKSGMIGRQDVRGMVRCLRQQAALHYMPDQDYGRERSVFVPFMGVKAATIKSTGQLLKMGRAVPIGYRVIRKKDMSGYHVQIFPPETFAGLGEGDEIRDAKIINHFVEECIVEHPDQYLWVHRRFKTREDEEDNDFYGLQPLKYYERQQKRRKKRQG